MVYFLSVLFQNVFQSFPRDIIGVHSILVRIDQRNKFVITVHNKRFTDTEFVIDSRLKLFRIDVLPTGSKDQAFTSSFYINEAFFINVRALHYHL